MHNSTHGKKFRVLLLLVWSQHNFIAVILLPSSWRYGINVTFKTAFYCQSMQSPGLSTGGTTQHGLSTYRYFAEEPRGPCVQNNTRMHAHKYRITRTATCTRVYMCMSGCACTTARIVHNPPSRDLTITMPNLDRSCRF